MRICEFCNYENEEGVKFCGKCGEKMPEKETDKTEIAKIAEAVEKIEEIEEVGAELTAEGVNEITGTHETEKSIVGVVNNKTGVNNILDGVSDFMKKIPLVKILKIAAPVFLLIIIAIIAVPLIIGPNISLTKNSIEFFSNGDSVIVSGNNKTPFVIDGRIDSSKTSLDGSKAVLMTDYGSDGGTLWFVTPSGGKMIAEEVIAYQFADSGNGVAYLTEYFDKDDTAELYLYDTKSKKATFITDGASHKGGSTVMDICISPDGKSVAYKTDYDRSSGEFTGVIKIKGKPPEKLGVNTYAVAISDGGKYIYYVKNTRDYSRSLNVKKGNKDNKLISDMHSMYSVDMALNKDYSQAVFDVDGKTFISRNGGERVKLSNKTMYMLLLPRGGQKIYNDGIAVYGVRSFANTIIEGYDGLEFINNKFITNKISGSSSLQYAALSKDGKVLLTLNYSGKLSKVNPTKRNANSKEIVKKAEWFIASDDCRSVFVLNRDDELYSVKGNGKLTKIADEVDESSLVVFGRRIFFVSDYTSNGGELYCYGGGGKPNRIAYDVTSLYRTATSVFYKTYEDDVYRSCGNEKFKLFKEALQDNEDQYTDYYDDDWGDYDYWDGDWNGDWDYNW